MVTRSGPMACPVDGTPLVMSERQSIEIDYCPTCRGVWLDRGELDKIIERAAAPVAPAAPQAPPTPQAPQAPQPGPWVQPQTGYGQRQNHSYGHGHGHGHYPKRRKSFLEEIFD